MGTSAFGGAVDLSQTLAYAYTQYQDHLTSLTNRADQRSTDAARAADADMLGKWQSGDVTDAAFLAYAKQRNQDSFSDPQEKEYWSKTLRDAKDTIKQRGIATTAQSLIDGVQAGKNTWGDLQKFYIGQRKSLRPNDPMYKQLSDQITQVNGQIRDNAINGGIQKAEYQFKTNQITGTQAGAAIRSLAGRYKNEDPAKYYQLLQSAADLTTFGGMYTTGTGGSGGGGGSGGYRRRGPSNATLQNRHIGDVIDAYKAARDAIESLGKQFDKGATIGVDSQGGKHVLRNPDGTPSQDMLALDSQAMDVFSLLGKAYSTAGKNDMAEKTAAAAQTYLTDKIQPRNTIGADQQMMHLLGAVNDQLVASGSVNDPQHSAALLRASLDNYKSWLDKQNAGGPLTDTTNKFFTGATQIYNAMEQSVEVGGAGGHDLSGIVLPPGLDQGLVSALMGTKANPGMLGQIALSAQIVTGLYPPQNPDGTPGTPTWGWYMDPEKGLGPVPLGSRTNVDGSQSQIPVNPDPHGTPFNADSLTQMVATTAGGPVAAFAPMTSAHRWTGAPLVDASGVVVAQTGAWMNDREAKKVADALSKGTITGNAGDLQAYQRVVVNNDAGQSSVWFGSRDANGQVTGWSQSQRGMDGNFSPDAPSYTVRQGVYGPGQQALKPMIIDAPNAYHAVAIAQQMKLDPTAYYNGQDLRTQSPGLHGSLAGTPTVYGGSYATPVSHTMGGGFTQNADFAGNAVPQDLRAMAQHLGITGPSLPPIARHVPTGGGFTATGLPGISRSSTTAPDNSGLAARVAKAAAVAKAAYDARAAAAQAAVPPAPAALPPLPFATSTPAEIAAATQHLAGRVGGGMIR